jgi:hypothetical protein
MPEHFMQFITTRTSPGVVLIVQDLPYSEAIDGLVRLWLTAEAEDWENVISFLPH